jgi:hypothetical protein
VEGIYFYWLSWLIWIIYTFFMRKDRFRLFVCSHLLLLIILSAYEMTIGPFQFSFAYLFLLAVAYRFVMKRRGRAFIYFAFASAIVTITYVSFHLLALFDPVWIFMNETWMLACMLVCVTFALYRPFFSRLLLLTVGCCQGEFLYSFILRQFSFHNLIGSLFFFDGWMLSVSFLFAWRFFEQLPTYVDSLFQRRMKEMKT